MARAVSIPILFDHTHALSWWIDLDRDRHCDLSCGSVLTDRQAKLSFYQAASLAVITQGSRANPGYACGPLIRLEPWHAGACPGP